MTVKKQNNPLYGLKLEVLLTEISEHYTWPGLSEALCIDRFNFHTGMKSTSKFLRNNQWAREKVEVFYLYEFKNLPRVSSEQFKLPPRERIIPAGVVPKSPKELSIEDGERLNEKRAKKASHRDTRTGARMGSSKSYNERRNSGFYKSAKVNAPSEPEPAKPFDPWGNFKGGSGN